MRDMVLIVFLTALIAALTGCAGQEGEACGVGSSGCDDGLYCEGDYDALDEAGVVSEGQGCGGGGALFPSDGVCVKAKGWGDPCEGFWRECEGGLVCRSGVCMPGSPDAGGSNDFYCME